MLELKETQSKDNGVNEEQGPTLHTQQQKTLDDLLLMLGCLGNFHRRFLVVLVLINVGVIYQNVCTVFTLTTPDHRCKLPDLTNDSYLIQGKWHSYMVNESIPLTHEHDYEKCTVKTQRVFRQMPVRRPSSSSSSPQGTQSNVHSSSASSSTIMSSPSLGDEFPIPLTDESSNHNASTNTSESVSGHLPSTTETTETESNDEESVSTCSAWVYDRSVFKRTLTTDLNLVCDNKILRSHSNMLLFAGKFLGAILQGFSSDRFGRRPTLIVTSTGILVTVISNGFISSVHALLALRFFTGFFTTSAYLASFVLAIECMAPRHRTVVSSTARNSISVGMLTMAPLAYLIRDWRYLQFAFAWPALPLIICLCFVTESPRWLIANNKMEQAKKILKRAAKLNGVSLPEDLTPYLNIKKEEASAPVYQLFTDVRLALRWAVVYFNWVVVAMVYYGLMLNISNLSGNIFLNFFLMSVVELVGSVFVSFFVTKFSRKYFHIAAMLLSGGACAAAFIPVLVGGTNQAVIGLSLVGKLGISCAFYLIYIYTAELFPTVHRGFGMGSSSMIARIGGMVSPYVADLNTYVSGDFGRVLPQLVFGGAGIIGGLLVFVLPDTRSQKLPETIADAKRLGREKRGKGISECGWELNEDRV